MNALGRFNVFSQIKNISTLYRSSVISDVQTVYYSRPTLKDSNSVEQIIGSNSVPIHHFVDGKLVTPTTKYVYSESTTCTRKQNSGLPKKPKAGLLSSLIYFQLPPAVRKTHLVRLLSAVIYSDGSLRQCIEKLEKESDSKIKFPSRTGSLTVYTSNDTDTLNKAETKVMEWVNSLLMSLEIIPIDLPIASVASAQDEFKTIVVGNIDKAFQKLKKETDSEIELCVIDNSIFAVVHSPYQETLKSAADTVKSRIQDIITNTEVIPVDLADVTIDSDAFKKIILRYRAVLRKLRKKTNSAISLQVTDSSINIYISAQNQETLKRDMEMVNWTDFKPVSKSTS